MDGDSGLIWPGSLNEPSQMDQIYRLLVNHPTESSDLRERMEEEVNTTLVSQFSEELEREESGEPTAQESMDRPGQVLRELPGIDTVVVEALRHLNKVLSTTEELREVNDMPGNEWIQQPPHMRNIDPEQVKKQVRRMGQRPNWMEWSPQEWGRCQWFTLWTMWRYHIRSKKTMFKQVDGQRMGIRLLQMEGMTEVLLAVKSTKTEEDFHIVIKARDVKINPRNNQVYVYLEEWMKIEDALKSNYTKPLVRREIYDQTEEMMEEGARNGVNQIHELYPARKLGPLSFALLHVIEQIRQLSINRSEKRAKEEGSTMEESEKHSHYRYLQDEMGRVTRALMRSPGAAQRYRSPNRCSYPRNGVEMTSPRRWNSEVWSSDDDHFYPPIHCQNTSESGKGKKEQKKPKDETESEELVEEDPKHPLRLKEEQIVKLGKKNKRTPGREKMRLEKAQRESQRRAESMRELRERAALREFELWPPPWHGIYP